MLDPTLNTYALAVAAASGTVAAGMHGTTVLTSHNSALSQRELAGQLIRTFVVGVSTSLVIRWLPWRFDLVAALVVAAVVGGTLGPRGLWWFLVASLSVVKKLLPVLSSVPDPPSDVQEAEPPKPPDAAGPPTPEPEVPTNENP